MPSDRPGGRRAQSAAWHRQCLAAGVMLTVRSLWLWLGVLAVLIGVVTVIVMVIVTAPH